MQVLCILPALKQECLSSLAEACLAFSPQVALGEDAVFVEIGGSRNLFSFEDCLKRLGEILQAFSLPARVATAADPATAYAFARYGKKIREELPVEALTAYLSPFAPVSFAGASYLRKLGIETLGDFLRIPRREIPSRFGKEGLLAYERYLRAEEVAWPRFTPPEILQERADFDFAARIENLEPVLFLLKNVLHRIFLRLHARRQKLAAFDLCFHLNRFGGQRERISQVNLPLPQSDPAALLAFLRERLEKELERKPLEEALEALSVRVLETAPGADTQREFFSKAEEERETWASLVARLRERLGAGSSFLASPSPRLLPEASWEKTLDAKGGIPVLTPLRPLRLLKKPALLLRKGERLQGAGRSWKIRSFLGPERLSGEWWLEHFEREYYRVETEEEMLWVFRSSGGLFLHGFFD